MYPTRNLRSIRLRGYDYSRAGEYVVNICVQKRECLFGDIADGKMGLNDAGRMVETIWYELPDHYGLVNLDSFVVMPSHVHGIVLLRGTVGAGFKPAPTGMKRHGLAEIIRGFKTFSSRYVNEIRKTPGTKLWQRNYYEHIIRNEKELNRIRDYVVQNPKKWEWDRENPNGIGTGKRGYRERVKDLPIRQETC